MRQEYDNEVARYKAQVKLLKSQQTDVLKRTENQQDKIDKLSGVLLEKQMQLDILSESLQTVQGSSNSQILVKYLSQNAELC